MEREFFVGSVKYPIAENIQLRYKKKIQTKKSESMKGQD